MSQIILTGTDYIFQKVPQIPPPIQPPYVKIGDPTFAINGTNIIVTHGLDALSDTNAALDLIKSNTPNLNGIYTDQKKT